MERTKPEPTIENRAQLLKELTEQARNGGQRDENRLQREIEAERQKRRDASGSGGIGDIFGGDGGGDGGGGGGGD